MELSEMTFPQVLALDIFRDALTQQMARELGALKEAEKHGKVARMALTSLVERVVLRVNAYHYICEQSTNKGGLAAYRNRDREYEQCEMLIKKWGGAYLQLRRNEQRTYGKAKKVRL